MHCIFNYSFSWCYFGYNVWQTNKKQSKTDKRKGSPGTVAVGNHRQSQIICFFVSLWCALVLLGFVRSSLYSRNAWWKTERKEREGITQCPSCKTILSIVSYNTVQRYISDGACLIYIKPLTKWFFFRSFFRQWWNIRDFSALRIPCVPFSWILNGMEVKFLCKIWFWIPRK